MYLNEQQEIDFRCEQVGLVASVWGHVACSKSMGVQVFRNVVGHLEAMPFDNMQKLHIDVVYIALPLMRQCRALVANAHARSIQTTKRNDEKKKQKQNNLVILTQNHTSGAAQFSGRAQMFYMHPQTNGQLISLLLLLLPFPSTLSDYKLWIMNYRICLRSMLSIIVIISTDTQTLDTPLSNKQMLDDE